MDNLVALELYGFESPSVAFNPEGQKYCKVGVQMVVIGLQSGKRAYMLTPEEDNYSRFAYFKLS